MSLGGYVLRRLLHLVPISLGVTVLVFFLIHLVPGDPARTILGNQATDARVAALRHVWGLGRLFPVGGYGSGFFGQLHSMFLPSLTVAVAIAPILVRSLRASLLEVLESEYVTTARSKGLPERRVLVRHALRNAVISTVTVLGVNIGYLVGGTLLIEQVYGIPGVGQLMIASINQRDFPVVQAVTFAFAVMVVLVYLVTDVVHALLDPRVRFD